jgi:hypothetical protein
VRVHIFVSDRTDELSARFEDRQAGATETEELNESDEPFR